MFVRVAYSLDVLLREVNVWAPMRSKASDGALGNAAHAATASDHNPNSVGVVCARDITNDPDGGCDALVLGERIRINRHPDLKYVIHHPSRTMFSSYAAHGFDPYTWRPYSGAVATELHVSVGVGRDGQSLQPYDDVDPWRIAEQPAPAPQPPTSPTNPLTEEEPMQTMLMPDGTVYVFIVGTDHAVWRLRFAPGATQPDHNADGSVAWASMGGQVGSPVP